MVEFDDFASPHQECYEYKIIMGGWFRLIRMDDNFSGMSLVEQLILLLLCVCAPLDAIVEGYYLCSDIILVNKEMFNNRVTVRIYLDDCDLEKKSGG